MILKDKIVLVTGGAQGLGLEIVKTLRGRGAKVIASDINEELLGKLKEDLSSEGTPIDTFFMDVSSKDSIEDAVLSIKEKFGKIDVLINNAGIDITKPIEELSIDEFCKVVDVNLTGPFILSKHAFEQMKDGGHIVNITSTASKRTWANASSYHASKWGLLGLSNALHVEGREKNIKVTAIIAGGMRTPFILGRFPDTPLDVLQDPKNVANTVKFVLEQPDETVISEVMVLPVNETSWP